MDLYPRESLNSGAAGQMTALMRAASTGPRVLRIGVVRGTGLVDDRILKILKPGATVTIGPSESNTFVIADPNAPVVCRLFEFSDGAYFLNMVARPFRTQLPSSQACAPASAAVTSEP